MSKRITIRINDQTKEKLDKIAEQNAETITEIVIKAIEEYLSDSKLDKVSDTCFLCRIGVSHAH